MRKDGHETSLLKALERIGERDLRDGLQPFLKHHRDRTAKLERRALRDGLTGLLFRHCLEDEYERISRNHQVISLLMLDIDCFRLINDRFGLTTGDGILQLVSSVVIDAVREKDACFRYGGDEFLILLAGTNSSGALRFAERLRKAINRRSLEVLTVPLTVSLGIAECPRHSYRLEDLIRMADLASLQAKLDGRNRTVIFESELAAGTVSPVTPGLASPVSNLPQQSTPFVGRQAELEEIAAQLVEEDCRLLTLVGPEGIGKTRLALEAASRASEDYPHGAYFVPLSRLTIAEHLASSAAGALALSIYADGDAGSQLLSYLEDKQLLLTMDGFEGIADRDSRLLTSIMREAPLVKILTTSRTRLKLKGERVMEIGGMSDAAIELFRYSSQRVYPGLTFTREEAPLTSRLCDLLEGIPLGIELAASWMRSLPLAEITAGVEKELGAEGGREVLKSALEYSYRLLKPEERNAFRKTSIFPGGFKREAAEEVAGAGSSMISALLAGSLLRRGLSGRYEMHGVVRSFGLEKLAEDALEFQRTRDFLSNYYLRSMQDCELDYLQSRQLEAIATLEEEAGNIREAWSIALEDLRLEEINRSISSLYFFYDIKGWLEEGESLLGSLVELLQASVGEARPHRRIEKEVLGRALTRRGCLALSLGRYEEAGEFLGDGLRFLRELNLREEIAFNLLHAGRLSEITGDHTWAAGLNRESLDIFRKIGDRQGVAYALANLASNNPSGPGESRKLYRDSLAIFSELKDLRGISSTSKRLGMVCLRLGEPEEARRCFEESLSIDRQLGDKRGVSLSLMGLGTVSEMSGDPSTALDFYGRSVDACRDVGYRSGIIKGLMSMGTAHLVLKDHAASLARLKESLGTALDADSAPLALEAMVRVGELLADMGETGQALEVAGRVLSCEESGPETRERAEGLRDRLSPESSGQASMKATARRKKESWKGLGLALLDTEA